MGGFPGWGTPDTLYNASVGPKIVVIPVSVIFGGGGPCGVSTTAGVGGFNPNTFRVAIDPYGLFGLPGGFSAETPGLGEA